MDILMIKVDFKREWLKSTSLSLVKLMFYDEID